MSRAHLIPRPLIMAARMAAGGLLLVGSVSVSAGTATVVSAEGDSMDFEYASGDLMRMSTAQDSYMLVRDNKLYFVGYEDGQAMVFDASSMVKGLSGMIEQAAPSATMNEFVSLEKTGRSETVAGIRGEVYLLTVIEDGKQRTDELVMSKDSRAIEFRDALFTMSRAAVAMLDDDGAAGKAEELEARLGETGLGVLRVGSEMTVTSISGDSVASTRFDLPAEPMQMQGLGDIMGAIGQQSAPGEGGAADSSEGGLFSGMMDAIGDKMGRQSDRTTDKVDDEVDEQTDDAVDNVLDKAFGKLFGR